MLAFLRELETDASVLRQCGDKTAKAGVVCIKSAA